MNPTTDMLIDRKRLKSRLIMWRSVALIAVFGVAALYSGHLGKRVAGPVGGHRLRVEFEHGADRDDRNGAS